MLPPSRHELAVVVEYIKAWALAWCNAGKSIAAKDVIIAIKTRSSIKVKAAVFA